MAESKKIPEPFLYTSQPAFFSGGSISSSASSSEVPDEKKRPQKQTAAPKPSSPNSNFQTAGEQENYKRAIAASFKTKEMEDKKNSSSSSSRPSSSSSNSSSSLSSSFSGPSPSSVIGFDEELNLLSSKLGEVSELIKATETFSQELESSLHQPTVNLQAQYENLEKKYLMETKVELLLTIEQVQTLNLYDNLITNALVEFRLKHRQICEDIWARREAVVSSINDSSNSPAAIPEEGMAAVAPWINGANYSQANNIKAKGELQTLHNFAIQLADVREEEPNKDSCLKDLSNDSIQLQSVIDANQKILAQISGMRSSLDKNKPQNIEDDEDEENEIDEETIAALKLSEQLNGRAEEDDEDDDEDTRNAIVMSMNKS